MALRQSHHVVGFILLACAAACAVRPTLTAPANAPHIRETRVTIYVEPKVKITGAAAGEVIRSGWDRSIADAVRDALPDAGLQPSARERADAIAVIEVLEIDTALIGTNVVRVKARLDVVSGESVIATSYFDGPGEWGNLTTAEFVPVIAKSLVYSLGQTPSLVAFADAHAHGPAPAVVATTAAAPAAQTPARTRTATVVFKDGKRLRGALVRNEPGELVSIEVEGRTRTFPWGRVDEVLVEGP